MGSALVLLPGGVDAVRNELLERITDEDRAAAAAGFGDPELADQ